MSTKRKLILAGSVTVAVVAGALGAVEHVRQSQRRSTAEHWIALLSGAKQSRPVQNPPAKAGAPAELIGRTGYPLYRA